MQTGHLVARWACALGLLTALGAHAQIVVGQTAGFSGPVAAGVKETTDGARLYLDAVNARGGIHGQKVELVSLDDKFEPKLAAENALKLITERQVAALFLTRGTPHTQALAPLLVAYKVPLIGPSTGAMVLHEPVHPYIFNVRATYQREAERAVRHLSLSGMERIAVVHVDDSFGADAMEGASKGFAGVNKTPVLVEKFDRSHPDFGPVAQKIQAADVQAVLFIGAGTALVEGTRAIRTAGSRAQVVTLSNNASSGFVKSMGELARGTIITQVFPYERSISAPIVKEALELAKARGASEVSPAMMEGYASAKVLVEALRRAGPSPSRERILAALHSLRKFDLGGMEISYTPSDHSGLDYADLSIIDDHGRFRR
ncbi:ABC transporter substrate-binding protein [Aquabacterium sp. A7-Y]|uniref:ABC transporter substrate-binding protein n=1 Tax=Aquabacterium sp. A7-Y TaxID=1349605 RepID=UPI00223D3651|nr:ABC transporter substrate-binding protein [Aquabacterium sp. A7-Y]MCW7537218.1 ABC transporter substrate-binding protein [Aquabacterium sp. A7-Y]